MEEEGKRESDRRNENENEKGKGEDTQRERAWDQKHKEAGEKERRRSDGKQEARTTGNGKWRSIVYERGRHRDGQYECHTAGETIDGRAPRRGGNRNCGHGPVASKTTE